MTAPFAPATDQDLLLRHAREASDDAFAELARRHTDLIFSAALRQLNGDHAQASEVVQDVFLELARKAERVARHPAPVGWLHTTTRRMALRRMRHHRVRTARERDAMAVTARDPGNEAMVDWERLGPVLDEALMELREADRLAILWRYFERRSFPEPGARLGLGENGARMRVARALEKLRGRLRRRGITSSASAVALALEGGAVTAAPAGLAAVAASLASPAAAPLAAAASPPLLIVLMKTSTASLGVGVLIAAILGTGLWIQTDRLRRLRSDHSALLQQLAEGESERSDLGDPGRRDALADDATRRLQEEVLRLRGEVARLRRDGAAAPVRTRPVTSAAAPVPRPLPPPLRATLPPGHSLVTGGWEWTEGRRAVVISTPSHKVGSDGQAQVDIESRVWLLSEAAMNELGLASLIPQPDRESGYRELSPAERSDLFTRVEGRPEIETLGNPRFSTTSGTGGSVGMSSDDLPDVVVVGMVPTVTADGQVDLELEFRRESLPSESPP